MRNRIRALMTLIPTTMLIACERPAPHPEQALETKAGADNQWVAVNLEHLTDAQSAQIATANESRDMLASTLKGELMSAIRSGGPVSAIDVCHTRAPAIAAQVSAEQGVQIGRTSHKLRNGTNTGPSWMQAVVEGQVAEPHAFADAEGELAIAYPIMLENGCVICHGQPAQIAPAVQDAIAVQYPEDEATGFTPGDLRGWLWVEVPPAD